MLFIDSNQYLDFYEKPGLKRLLKPLAKVSDRVFITSQIVDEVTRNKVSAAKKFFTYHFAGLGKQKTIEGLPDQLFSPAVTSELQGKLNNICDQIKATHRAADKAVGDLLLQISQSDDDVSKAFARIFGRAEDADLSELDRARARKERGIAPGKPDDSLGDQISWEQFLTSTEKENWAEVWIISRDGDFCTKYAKTVVLNAALYRDLVQKHPRIVVHCFTEMEKGLRHFTDANSVEDAQLPTLEEAEAINKEQEATLPPIDWAFFDDGGWSSVAQQYAARQNNFRAATWMPPNITIQLDDADPPPETSSKKKASL